MAWIIQTTDETTEQNFDTGDTYVLTQDASIIVGGGSGLMGVSQFSTYDVTLFIDGEIIARNFAVYTGSDNGSSTGVGGSYVYVGATGSVTNLFSAQPAITMRGSDNDLVNAGQIRSVSYSVDARGNDNEVDNSGTITSLANYAVRFTGAGAGDTSQMNNSGTVTGQLGAVYATTQNLDLTNSGTLNGGSGPAVYLNSDGFSLDLVNTGLITTLGSDAIRARNGNDNVVNHGQIIGDIDLDEGVNDLLNTGTITGSLTGGFNTDEVTNSGTISGVVSLESGNDTYNGSGDGTVLGGIDLGGGDDTATLGNLGGAVEGGSGDDTITGGAGADMIEGDGDNDLIRGREGDDVIAGGSGNDTLRAGNGDDEIEGGTGDDIIRGGAGEDIITGGTGLDILFGGAGADTFIYLDETDSPDDNSLRDIIQDFVAGQDQIDVSAFAGLTYIGDSAFSGTGAEISVSDPNAIGRVKIFLDTDGDGTADMKIILNNTTALSEDDFIF